MVAGWRRGWIVILLAACAACTSSSRHRGTPASKPSGPPPRTFRFVETKRDPQAGLPLERLTGVVDLSHDQFSQRDWLGDGAELDEIYDHSVVYRRTLRHGVVVDPWRRECPDADTKWDVAVESPYGARASMGVSFQGYQRLGLAGIDGIRAQHFRIPGPPAVFDLWVDTKRDRLLRSQSIILGGTDQVDYGSFGESVAISDPIELAPCHNSVA
jgi:hypothetical protein